MTAHSMKFNPAEGLEMLFEPKRKVFLCLGEYWKARPGIGCAGVGSACARIEG